jgi:hypothetical protein
MLMFKIFHFCSGPTFDDYDDESDASGDDISDDYYGNYVDENSDYQV